MQPLPPPSRRPPLIRFPGWDASQSPSSHGVRRRLKVITPPHSSLESSVVISLSYPVHSNIPKMIRPLSGYCIHTRRAEEETRSVCPADRGGQKRRNPPFPRCVPCGSAAVFVRLKKLPPNMMKTQNHAPNKILACRYLMIPVKDEKNVAKKIKRIRFGPRLGERGQHRPHQGRRRTCTDTLVSKRWPRDVRKQRKR